MVALVRVPILLSVFFICTFSGFSQTLNDLRVQIDYNAAVFPAYGTAAAQQDFNNGVDMALRMWQSILPDMHFRRVTSGGNFFIRLTNWTACPCGVGFNHSGCQCGNSINLHPRVGFWSMQFGAYSRISRDDVYMKYEPATAPPLGYGDPGLGNGVGYSGGRYHHGGTDVNINEGLELASILFHEFGHFMGMPDQNWINPQLFHVQDFINAYGQPHVGGATSGPPQPALVVPTVSACGTTVYPTIPSIPYNGQQMYYGGGATIRTGGSCIFSQFERYSPWVSAFITSNPAPLAKNTGLSGTLPPGVTGAIPALFNERLVTNFDVSPSISPRDVGTWPEVGGIIRLMRTDGLVRVANNWYSAIDYAQLLYPVQSNPYFVDSLYPECNNLKTVGAGAKFTAAIRVDGKVFAWGDNSYGQLGIGNKTSKSTPVQTSLTYQRIRSLACGDNHMMMLDTLGFLWACGNNANGQIGNNSTTTATSPVMVGDISGQACQGNHYATVAAGA
jgi:hypothetical protein